ncbi:MAG: hypothetical protein QW695_05345 [Candidatus Bathyarchaeia archaeon]
MNSLTTTRILGVIGLAIILVSFIIPWATFRFEYLNVEYTLIDLLTLILNPNPVEVGGFKARLIISIYALANPEAVDAVLAFKMHVTLSFLSLVLGVLSVILDMRRSYASNLVCIILSSTLFVYSILRLYGNTPPTIALMGYSYELGVFVYTANSIIYVACILVPRAEVLAEEAMEV